MKNNLFMPKLTGFTLFELVVVIAIMSILSGIFVTIIKKPVDAYVDTTRRAEMVEEANSALRLITREIRSAVPNSVSCAGNNRIIAQKALSGGRYREYTTSAGAGTPLRFGTATTQFQPLGVTAGSVSITDATGRDLTTSVATTGVVVGNMSPASGACNSTTFIDNFANLSALVPGLVSFASTSFPSACQLQSATATNDAGTAINEENDRGFGRYYLVKPTTTQIDCTGPDILKDGAVLLNSATCQVFCDTAANARVQTISIKVTVTRAGESLSMVRQAHVENLP